MMTPNAKVPLDSPTFVIHIPRVTVGQRLDLRSSPVSALAGTSRVQRLVLCAPAFFLSVVTHLPSSRGHIHPNLVVRFPFVTSLTTVPFCSRKDFRTPRGCPAPVSRGAAENSAPQKSFVFKAPVQNKGLFFQNFEYPNNTPLPAGQPNG